MTHARKITPTLALVIGCATLGWIAAASAQQRAAGSASEEKAESAAPVGRWQIREGNRGYYEGDQARFAERWTILLDSHTGTAYVMYPMTDPKREKNDNDPGYSWVEIPRHSFEEISGPLYKEEQGEEEQAPNEAAFFPRAS